MITLNYTLGVYPAYNGTVAKLSQYSNDFTLIFTLTNDYGDFVLEDGTTAQIRGTKADGNGYSANCTIDIEAQTVTVTGDEQITAAAGDNTFEIRLIKGGKILNTVNFTIWVERAALDAGTITSDSVLLELNAIIEGAQTATEAAASASESAAEAATSAATLRLDPTLTQSGESADAKVVGDALASGLAARYNSASPYAVGDYMLKDNVLYHVTRAIPAGGAVTVGTNVEIAPLGNAVTALNSKLVYHSYGRSTSPLNITLNAESAYLLVIARYGSNGLDGSGMTAIVATAANGKAERVFSLASSNDYSVTVADKVLTIANASTTSTNMYALINVLKLN
jgi:hypothetical protein